MSGPVGNYFIMIIVLNLTSCFLCMHVLLLVCHIGFAILVAFMVINSFQAVYNANKFARLVRQRERLQNWLDYSQLKFERNPDKRPTRKVVSYVGSE